MEIDEIESDAIMRTLKTNYESNPQKKIDVEFGALQFRIQMVLENERDVDLKSQAIKAYQSFIRSYATHTKARLFLHAPSSRTSC